MSDAGVLIYLKEGMLENRNFSYFCIKMQKSVTR